MNWIIKLIKLIWAQVSPQLREMLIAFVKELEKKAQDTKNEWDDVAVAILKMFLGID